MMPDTPAESPILPAVTMPSGATCTATVKASSFVGDNFPTTQPWADHRHCLTALKLDQVLGFFRIPQQLPLSPTLPPHLTHSPFREVALMSTITPVGRRI